MSTLKKGIKINFESGKRFKVNLELYGSAQEVVRDCQKRTVRGDGYEDMRTENIHDDWHGVNNYDEALRLMETGYQPTVDKLKSALKANVFGEQKRIKFENNVHGFVPIVPLAMKGVPNSMVNMTMKPIKAKVVDVYYDITDSCGTSIQTMTKSGQKLLGAIIELEKQGYKFNLYAIQSYTDSRGADVLCVKIKSSNAPLDIKRMSFPLTHPAFFRVIGFDWQGKCPIARYIGYGRGHALTREITDKEASEMIRQLFGKNAIYIAGKRIKDKDEDYIKEVLTNEKQSR